VVVVVVVVVAGRRALAADVVRASVACIFCRGWWCGSGGVVWCGVVLWGGLCCTSPKNARQTCPRGLRRFLFAPALAADGAAIHISVIIYTSCHISITNSSIH
jgi:hypothetical protein